MGSERAPDRYPRPACENAGLRGEIARLKRTIDQNAAALFVRAISPDSDVVLSRSRGEWRVAIPYPVGGQGRVAYAASLSEAFGNLANSMRGQSF